MYILRTGLQGNGKTLNTIKEVDEKAFSEKRTVYYCNITDFDPSHAAIKATWIQFDTPEKWFELPANAIIVIDEAQTWFRVRPQGSKVPEYASRLEIMRKDGHELHAITQSPLLIDSHMRELCNQHIHYNRGHGGAVIKRWVFQKPELTVNKNKVTFPNGEFSRITIDKNYFGCYKSVKEGSEHHFKFKPPRALIVLAICLVFIAVLSYRFYTHRIAPSAPAPVVPVVPGEVSQQGFSSVSGEAPLTQQQYIDAHIPRVPDVPSSAPIFDQVTKAVSYPRPFCVSTQDTELLQRSASRMSMGYSDGRLKGCRCNSQQGTRMDISFEACLSYVDSGAFDPARADPVIAPKGVAQPVGPTEVRGGTAGGAVADQHLTVSSAHYIPEQRDLPHLNTPIERPESLTLAQALNYKR